MRRIHEMVSRRNWKKKRKRRKEKTNGKKRELRGGEEGGVLVSGGVERRDGRVGRRGELGEGEGRLR